jgi:cytochrome c oxidase subunit 2
MHWILAQASSGGTFWMPEKASTVAPTVDNVFYLVFWITAFFTLLIAVLTVAFVIKYRYRPGQRESAEKAPAHNTALELTWTIVPTVLVLIVFYFGFRGYLNMAVIPPHAYEITVTAKSWNWEFTYPNGGTSSELHVPVNVPVRLVLTVPNDSTTGRDVIHSFFVPQFRVKKDAVPGRFNTIWFEATELSPPGGFDIYCTEYCGAGHSRMRSKVIVQEMPAFKKYLEEVIDWTKQEGVTSVKAGENFVRTAGCMMCHTIDGTKSIGPSLKNVYGEEQPLANGSKIVADLDYIRESIYDPSAKIVAGFTPQMPSYRARFRDQDIIAIADYLRTISEKHKDEPSLWKPTTAPTTAEATATAAASTTAPAGATTQPGNQ